MPVMSIDIHALQAADRAAWENLWGAYQAFYQVALPAAVTEATWARLLDGRIHGLGARDAGGNLVGIVHFLYHQDTWSEAPACYLQDLYVAPVTHSGSNPGFIQYVYNGSPG